MLYEDPVKTSNLGRSFDVQSLPVESGGIGERVRGRVKEGNKEVKGIRNKGSLNFV